MIDYASVKFVRDHTTVLKFFEGGEELTSLVSAVS